MDVHLNDLGGWIVVLTAPNKAKGMIVPVQGMTVLIIANARPAYVGTSEPIPHR